MWRHITAIRRVDATAGQEAERQRKAAKRSERRALVFLARQLNEVQRSEFRTFRYFHVTGGKSGDRYLIRPDKAANIDVLLADGRTKHRLCASPVGVPLYAMMAAQLLYLQDPESEQRFLRRAKVHPDPTVFPGLPGIIQ
ncbi:hypothetical protein [Noviherbaspirillum sp. ST9]|uniref:hypothetical protein n=1 Tax=Noviherbaspirillum sp. ST9 TaxID=3401606 RepID=UPI003B588571